MSAMFHSKLFVYRLNFLDLYFFLKISSIIPQCTSQATPCHPEKAPAAWRCRRRRHGMDQRDPATPFWWNIRHPLLKIKIRSNNNRISNYIQLSYLNIFAVRVETSNCDTSVHHKITAPCSIYSSLSLYIYIDR